MRPPKIPNPPSLGQNEQLLLLYKSQLCPHSSLFSLQIEILNHRLAPTVCDPIYSTPPIAYPPSNHPTKALILQYIPYSILLPRRAIFLHSVCSLSVQCVIMPLFIYRYVPRSLWGMLNALTCCFSTSPVLVIALDYLHFPQHALYFHSSVCAELLFHLGVFFL